MSKKKTTKKIASKKVSKAKKPKTKKELLNEPIHTTSESVAKFWNNFEQDLYAPTEKVFDNYSSINFQGHFKTYSNPNKESWLTRLREKYMPQGLKYWVFDHPLATTITLMVAVAALGTLVLVSLNMMR